MTAKSNIYFLVLSFIFTFFLVSTQAIFCGETKAYSAEVKELISYVKGQKEVKEPERINLKGQKEVKKQAEDKPLQAREKKEVKEPERINLNFSEAKIENVLRLIGKNMEKNIVVDPAIMGKKVNIHVKEVSVSEALQLLYRSFNLGSVEIGSSLFISTKNKIRQMGLVHKVIKVTHVGVESIMSLVEGIPEDIVSNKDLNVLTVTGTSSQIAKVEEIVKKLDKPQPQVLIRSQVLEVTKGFNKELGINWDQSLTINNQETGRTPVAIGDSAALISSAPAPFKFFRIARDPLTFQAQIKYLLDNDKAKLLANPKIVTRNEKKALIFIGDEVPYEITSVTGGVASTEVRFVDAGIKLEITPSIIEKDFVVIEIKTEVSNITAFKGQNSDIPQVSTRRGKVIAKLEDGQPFVIGGLIYEETSGLTSKIPLLSSVPLLGNIFTYKKETKDTKEVMITVTPTILP